MDIHPIHFWHAVIFSRSLCIEMYQNVDGHIHLFTQGVREIVLKMTSPQRMEFTLIKHSISIYTVTYNL